MRCTTKFTCIAQCLAATMLRRAGLLTEDDYARVTAIESNLFENDHSLDYEPRCFPGFAYQNLQFLKSPKFSDDDEPLNAVYGPRDCQAPAFNYYMEWREKSLNEYQDKLREYAKRTYEEGGFVKRSGADANNLTSYVDECTEELRQLFLSSERLRKSYRHIYYLMHTYDYLYYNFRDTVRAIGRNSKKLRDLDPEILDKSLESLSAFTIKKLNALRQDLDISANAKKMGESFNEHIYNSVLGTAEAPVVIDDNFIDTFQTYCEKALAYAHKVPERLSKDIILSEVFGMNDYDERDYDEEDLPMKKEEHSPVYLHFTLLRLVYPEMDYKVWGRYWQGIHNQVANELKVLQKHVEEVSNCKLNCDEIAPRLFEEFDAAVAEYGSDNQHGREEADEKLAGVIEAVAQKMLNQTHGEVFEKTTIDKADQVSQAPDQAPVTPDASVRRL
ncbi:hypothetical protein PAPHI01_1663 [Pancytospora philotis]|nr:hypothetical protein PAPHI01_1663 [Pancytospora philotis]